MDFENKRGAILGMISDLVTDLMYYDRKECSELSVGEIEMQINSMYISIDEMVDKFREELEKSLQR